MKIEEEILEGRFLERLNRFLVRVETADRLDRTPLCYLPNSGRLTDLLIPGARVLLVRRSKENRETRFDLFIVFKGETAVCVDSRVPNRLVSESLDRELIPELKGFTEIFREPVVGDCRLDLLLKNSEQCYLEIKSCTLVRKEVALFPDAPTERGRRHLEALIRLRSRGIRSCILFMIQRSDGKRFMPNDKLDPDFGSLLREGRDKGVEVYAYTSEYSRGEIHLAQRVSVEL